VVSSKSGGTVETDSQRRAFEAALVGQGLNPVDHIVIVTDPGSPLHHSSDQAGYRVFEGDATIGGRFSALSPFGLVPVGLAGVNLLSFLEDASVGYEACLARGENNPALRLGVALAQGHPTVNKILYREDPSHPGLGDWVEQLVAESTGKDGKGILPVVGSSLDALPDALSVGPLGSDSDIDISGSLPEHMILWEYATAVACAEIGVNPFDQPNVESAKIAARELLESASVASREEEDFDGLSVFARPLLPTLESLSEIPDFLGRLAGERGYIALCVFAPRTSQSLWREVGHSIERASGRPVTIGFGPRFLHSTGQLHKGGAPEGVFLQIIATTNTEVEIPGRDFGFSELLLSQAHGDARVLIGTGQPVISMTGSMENVARLVQALRA
jgi:glucose-6-phosphate isomerase